MQPWQNCIGYTQTHVSVEEWCRRYTVLEKRSGDGASR